MERKMKDSTPRVGSRTRRRFLRGTLGSVAAATAIPTLSGVAAAHFPLRLDIDVQPENRDNFVDLEAHESVPVAVHYNLFLNSDHEQEVFDPTEEAVRYRFGSRFTLDDGEGARPMEDGEVMEIDDARDALLLHFPVEEMGFDGGEETAWLYWEEDESGEHGYAGVDSVRVYGTSSADR